MHSRWFLDTTEHRPREAKIDIHSIFQNSCAFMLSAAACHIWRDGENKAGEATLSAIGCAAGGPASDDLNSRLTVGFADNGTRTSSYGRSILDDTTGATRVD
eukprot:6491449-Amphidinium_carterae.1